jgi:dihydroorotase
VNPPLRRERDRQALVAALVEGVIDVIATDHAPHRSIDKDCTYDDAAFGISGFETALGSLLTLAARGEMPVTEVIRRLTIEPARAFGLPSGTLSVGAEADVVIIDPTRRWTVCAADFHSRGKNTPLDGIELTGRVLVTLVAGRVVYRDGTEVRPDA